MGADVLGEQAEDFGRQRLALGGAALGKSSDALNVRAVVVGFLHLGRVTQQHDGDFLRLVFQLGGLLAALPDEQLFGFARVHGVKQAPA